MWNSKLKQEWLTSVWSSVFITIIIPNIFPLITALPIHYMILLK